MADCNDLFQKFLSEISLKPDQRKNLQTGRDAIKIWIENYFSEEKGFAKPEFCLQGSYALKTMVCPLGQEDYDLDDGVYLQHTDDDISKPTPETVSSYIVEAVKGHTKKVLNKKNCVRVVYAENYHIDLPVYRTVKGKIHLGTLEGNQWVPSDAKAFNTWFYDRLEETEQMRSCIKYLKAWKDFGGCDLKGIHLTILVGLNHVPVNDRDDKSLTETVGKIIEYLNDNKAIYNPIDEKEDLIKNWSVGKRAAAIDDLEKLYTKAIDALGEDDKEKAAKCWRMIFSDRFPVNDGKKRDSVVVGPSHREFESRTKPWRGI
ncbi:MAG: cyclic GMP-AMP synthase DncV-like nucleotidyltransferase [Planctomycetota bacterium]|jgi:hypothetical protein